MRCYYMHRQLPPFIVFIIAVIIVVFIIIEAEKASTELRNDVSMISASSSEHILIPPAEEFAASFIGHDALEKTDNLLIKLHVGPFSTGATKGHDFLRTQSKVHLSFESVASS